MKRPHAESIQINPFWVHGLADDGSSAIYQKTKNHLAGISQTICPNPLGPNLGLTIPFAGSVLYLPLSVGMQTEILEGAVRNAPDNLDVIVHSQGHLAAVQVFSRPEYASKARQLAFTAPVVDPFVEWKRVLRETDKLDAGETLQLVKDELLGQEGIESLGIDAAQDLDHVIRFPHPRDHKAAGCYAALTNTYLTSLEEAAWRRDEHLEHMARCIARPTTRMILAENEMVTDGRPETLQQYFKDSVNDSNMIVMPGADHRLYQPGVESARQYSDYAQVIALGARLGTLTVQDVIARG
jgi:hypothetical protein